LITALSQTALFHLLLLNCRRPRPESAQSVTSLPMFGTSRPCGVSLQFTVNCFRCSARWLRSNRSAGWSVHDRTAACPQIAHASASSERSGFDRHVERSGRSGKIERRFFVRLEQSPFRTGGVTLLIVPIAARSFCDGWLPQGDLPQPPEGR
jgi:hypothetical protein